MGLNKLFETVAILVFLAASTGQLPRIVAKVQVSQIHLLKASQSKSWGQALLLPSLK
jgi:hypothetical protein